MLASTGLQYIALTSSLIANPFMFIYKIARSDLSQFSSESNNHAHSSPFVQHGPTSLNALLGLEGDGDEAIADAYPSPKNGLRSDNGFSKRRSRVSSRRI